MSCKTNGKGPWSFEEDNKLLEWVKANGPQKWSLCSETIPGRSGKQCRERWFNNLNPNVKKGNWTAEEDDMIFQGYLQHGSSWSRIAKNLEGRTENSVKNRFYSTVRKLLSDSEKNSGKSSEQQIRSIIEMSLGKKVGGGSLTANKNNDHEDDSDKNSDSESESQEDKSNNERVGSSKGIKSSETAGHEGESGDGHTNKQKEEYPPPSKQKKSFAGDSEDTANNNKTDSKLVSVANNDKSQMDIEEADTDMKQIKCEGDNINKETIGGKSNNQNQSEHEQQGEGQEEENSSHGISSSQQAGGAGNLLKRKYNRKRHQDEYSESNLLYRLLKTNDVTIKNTKCLQDYSVFYRKYKQNKYMMKKKKKKDDDVKKLYNNNGEEEEEEGTSSNESDDEDEEEHNAMEDEEIQNQYNEARQQFLAANGMNLTEDRKSSKKNNKGKKSDNEDEKARGHSRKEEKRRGGASETNQELNDQEEAHRQMLLLQQRVNQQHQLDTKSKKKAKTNNSAQVKIEDLTINKNKNARNIRNTQINHSDDQDEDEHSANQSNLNRHLKEEEDEEDEDQGNSCNYSVKNEDDDERAILSNLPSDNQLEDVGEIESQLLKYFQKSMGQFFKNFIKKQKIGSKDSEKDKKSSKQKEIKKQQSQQQMIQLQIQEQIQKQLEQLNNQNGGMSSKLSKNNNGQAIQRANTIIQNPPASKTQGNNKKNSGAHLIAPDNSFEKQIQKQIQELQQGKLDSQNQNKDLKSSQETAKLNQKQAQQTSAAQQQSSSTGGKGTNQVSSSHNFISQKSSFQLNKNNNNTPTARGGYSNQIGSSTSLFSQPNQNVGNNNNNNNNGNLNLSQHSLQMQQQGQGATQSSSLSIQNLKSLLNQNMLGNMGPGGQTSQQQNNADQGVDQKMIFLLNQLNTLESMLSNTKKELVKLEASLNQRNGDNFSIQQQQQQQNANRNYLVNNLQNNNNNNNNLFGQNGFYSFQNSIPPTASVLNTLPSFGSRAAFDKSENGNFPYSKRKNSKDNTSQFSDFDKFINNNNSNNNNN